MITACKKCFQMLEMSAIMNKLSKEVIIGLILTMLCRKNFQEWQLSSQPVNFQKMSRSEKRGRGGVLEVKDQLIHWKGEPDGWFKRETYLYARQRQAHRLHSSCSIHTPSWMHWHGLSLSQTCLSELVNKGKKN